MAFSTNHPLFSIIYLANLQRAGPWHTPTPKAPRTPVNAAAASRVPHTLMRIFTDSHILATHVGILRGEHLAAAAAAAEAATRRHGDFVGQLVIYVATPDDARQSRSQHHSDHSLENQGTRGNFSLRAQIFTKTL